MTAIFIKFSPYKTESIDGINVCWAMFSENNEPVYESWEFTKLNEVAQTIRESAENDTKIIVFVPGETVLLTTAEFKKEQLGYINKTLPYVLEDKITDDVENLHFAVGSAVYGSGTRFPVAVINKSYLHQIKDALETNDIYPDILIPETLALPYDNQRWSLIENRDMVLLRTGINSGFSIENNLFPVLMRQLLKQESKSVLLLKNDSGSISLPPKLDIEEKSVNSDVFSVLCRNYLEQDASNIINMLQGEFAPKAKSPKAKISYKLPVILVVIFLVIFVVIKLGFGWYFNNEAKQNRQESIEIYKSLFPGDEKIIDIKKQVEGKLRLVEKRNSDIGFLKITGVVSQALNESAKDIKLNHIDFNKATGIYNMQIESGENDINNIDSFVKNINDKGLSAEIIASDGNITSMRIKE